MRLLTLNTAKGDPPYAGRLGLLADGLAALAPDVVLLQEVLAAGDCAADTARALADRTGLQLAFAPARRKERTVDGRAGVLSVSGLALLSRYPIRDTLVLPLPSDPADGGRIAQLALLEVSGTAMLVANVHLTHLRGAAPLRRAQVAATLAHPWFAQQRGARLLGGDLNTPLEDLAGLFAVTPDWEVLDLYDAGGGAEPRGTHPTRRAAEDRWCIDFLLSVARPGKGHPAVSRAATVLDEPGPSGIYPSDHCGVMATVVPVA